MFPPLVPKLNSLKYLNIYLNTDIFEHDMYISEFNIIHVLLNISVSV